MKGSMTMVGTAVAAVRKSASAQPSRRRQLTARSRALMEQAFDIQGVVLDRQWSWINELPISDAEKQLVFRRLCSTTGSLIDELFAEDIA